MSNEITRATNAENSINTIIGNESMGTTATSIKGAIAEILQRLNTLSATVGVINSLVQNQKTLIVSSNQDHRSTDLTIFSEIIIMAGNTLTVTLQQSIEIATKKKTDNSEWVLAFANNGFLHTVHATSTIDISAHNPVFNSLHVESGSVTMTTQQFQEKTVSRSNGVLTLKSNQDANLSSLNLSAVTHLIVNANIILSATQIANSNITMNSGTLTLMVSDTSNLQDSDSVLNASNAIIISGKLILTAHQASLHTSKITKQGNGLLEVKVTDATLPVQNLNLDKVDTIVVSNSTVTMSALQAEMFRTGITSLSSTIKIIETQDTANYTSFNLSQWNFDELNLQNTVLTLSASQAHHLSTKSVNKSNSSIIVSAPSTANISTFDLSKIDSIYSGADVVLTIDFTHVGIPIVKGTNASTILSISNPVDATTVSLSTIDSISLSSILRLNPAQLSIPIQNNSGTVILVIQNTSNQSTLDISNIQTVELHANVEVTMTIQQVSGKTFVKVTGGKLLATISGEANDLTFPYIDTLKKVNKKPNKFV